MTHTVQRHDDLKAGLLHIEGDVDISVVPELRSALESLLASGVTSIIVDLSDVTYADSSALGLLVWLDARLRDLDGHIVLSGASKDVARVLEISGLVSVARTLSSSETVAEALDSLEVQRRQPMLLWTEDMDMPAEVSELAAIRERVVDLLEPLAFSEASLFDMKVALGEALANAVRHGSEGVTGSVGVHLSVFDDRVAITVEDSGCGFDGVPTCDNDLYASGGRGIMFMRALMDQVEFAQGTTGGTIVTLVKHRTPAETG